MSLENQQDSSNRYLIFRINGTLYGSQLLDVREVVQYNEPKVIPNTRKHFSGVINLRGAIVGVIDMRAKCGFASQDDFKKAVFLVCETESGFLAAHVDAIESVVTIEDTLVEKNPPIQVSIEQRYMMGVAKVEDKLITLINLKNFLSEDKVTLDA